MQITTRVTVLLTALTMFLGPVATIAKSHDNADTSKAAQNVSKDDLGADQHPAPCLSWIDPLTKPRAALLCIHGLGLNSDSYRNFGVRMARRGIATFAIDVRGFGSWMRAKGNEQVNFAECLGDVQATLQSIRAANPGVPVFLLGESMGGAIALRACSMNPDLEVGLISSVPSGERFQQKKTDLKVALEFLKGRHKQFNIGTQIVDQATHDMPSEREDWASDPLDRMDLSAEQLLQFQKFMNDNHDAAKKITSTPVLMLQGTLDTLVKPEGTWEIFNELATRQKTFVALPSEHLVLEEGQAKSSKYDAKTAQMVAGWIFANSPDSNEDGAPDPSKVANPDQTSGTVSSALAVPATIASTPPPYTTGGAPTVLVFQDSWSAECQGLDQLLAKGRQISGVQATVKTINVQDPANTALVAAYKIGPVPTFVFLKSDGSLGSVLIGRCRAENIAQRMRAISTNPAAL